MKNWLGSATHRENDRCHPVGRERSMRFQVVTNASRPVLAHSVSLAVALFLWPGTTDAQERSALTFNKNFEGGALGKIEQLSSTRFRCFVEGQQDEQGRNRL